MEVEFQVQDQEIWRYYQLKEVEVVMEGNSMLDLELQSHHRITKTLAIISNIEMFDKQVVELVGNLTDMVTVTVICLTKINKTANSSINNMGQVLQEHKE